MSKKGNIILKCIICIFILAGLLILIFKENSPSYLIDGNVMGLLEENITSDKYTLDIYKVSSENDEEYMDDICYYYDEEDCNNKFLSINTSSEKSSLIYYYKYRYFFYQDGNRVKVYDRYYDKSYIIGKISPNYYSLSFEIDYKNDNFVGVIFAKNKNDKPSFYSIKSGQVLYSKKYDSLMLVDSKYLTADIIKEEYNKDEGISRSKDEYVYLLDANNESKPLLEYKNDSDYYSCNYTNEGNDKDIYVLYLDMYLKEIYNSDLELIYKNNTNEEEYNILHSIDSLDNIYIYNNNKISMYDSEGKLLKEGKKIDKIEDMIEGYAIVISDSLYLVDVNNKYIKIANWSNKLSLSDYWKENGNINFNVKDSNAKIDEVYNECKNNTCKNITKDDLNSDDYSFGYEYSYNINSSKISKKPIFIYEAGF